MLESALAHAFLMLDTLYKFIIKFILASKSSSAFFFISVIRRARRKKKDMINWSSSAWRSLLNTEGFLKILINVALFFLLFLWKQWIHNNDVIKVTWIINWDRQEIKKHVRWFCLSKSLRLSLLANCPFFFFVFFARGHKKIDNLILTYSLVFFLFLYGQARTSKMTSMSGHRISRWTDIHYYRKERSSTIR
jgi:hypothetical protein